MKKKIPAAVLAAFVMLSLPAAAEIAVSAHDNKVYNDNGTVKVYPQPAADNVAIIDMSASPPRIVSEVSVPTSVAGPPYSVAITRDESLALVTAAQKVDAADPTKVVADNKLSVIDLKANPPAVIATLESGAGAAGVSINRAGTLALVANRSEGTVSVFTIEGRKVSPAGKIKLGDEKSGPSHVAITPDGKRALVSRDGDHFVSVLRIDGAKVEATGREFGLALRPYGIQITEDGSLAVLAYVGRANDDIDIVSLVDLAAEPPRVVDAVTVPSSPEGIVLSPDGKTVAVVTHNGSNKAKSSPLYNKSGKLAILKIEGKRLVRGPEVAIGTWAQGCSFSRDGKTILVQNMVEKELQVVRYENGQLTDTGQRIKVNGGPVAMRTSW
jgi:DNA-binding beta-propeller fold protein YncE